MSTLHRWELVGLLWVAFFFNQADRQIFGVTLPLIQAEFGLTSTQMGTAARPPLSRRPSERRSS